MIGAPALAARGAFRAGAGLVKLVVPGEVLSAALTIEPGATGIAWGATAGDTEGLIEAADPRRTAVLAVGPGIGRSQSAAGLVNTLLQGERAVVLDADGLNLLASDTAVRLSSGPPLILTPHPGEYRRLADARGLRHDPVETESRPSAAAALAEAYHAVVVLKGHQTVVSDGGKHYVNTTGNPAMATAGSGDVLTGVIAALFAQGMTLFDAAVLGVYLHGLAGDFWAVTHGVSGLRAQELADQIPAACKQHRGSA